MDVLDGCVSASVEPEVEDFGQEVLVVSGGVRMPGRVLGEGKIELALSVALAAVAVLSLGDAVDSVLGLGSVGTVVLQKEDVLTKSWAGVTADAAGVSEPLEISGVEMKTGWVMLLAE